jgi:mevalonate kinase
MKAIAPGKLILSGEHAVVYGRPAVAMAIDLSAQTTITPADGSDIAFSLHNYGQHERFRIRALREMNKRIQHNYDLFLKGDLGIRDVLAKPIELVQFAFITLLDGLHLKLEQGVDIGMKSTIPEGCGLGSSAASVLSELRAVGHFMRVDFRPDWHYKYSLVAENMQHGHASGVDSFVSLHGGCVRFQDGNGVKVAMPSIPVFIVNTGKPETTTGECVEQVRKEFESDRIWNDFEDVTDEIAAVIGGRDMESIQAAVRQNHKLLCRIGVVPEPVQQFITDIESAGGAAKICGAGATKGVNGGIVMVIAEAPPIEICRRYGYHLSAVRGDPLGVRIVGN